MPCVQSSVSLKRVITISKLFLNTILNRCLSDKMRSLSSEGAERGKPMKMYCRCRLLVILLGLRLRVTPRLDNVLGIFFCAARVI